MKQPLRASSILRSDDWVEKIGVTELRVSGSQPAIGHRVRREGLPAVAGVAGRDAGRVEFLRFGADGTERRTRGTSIQQSRYSSRNPGSRGEVGPDPRPGPDPSGIILPS